MNKKKRIVLQIICMIGILLVSGRICYVNRHARLPKVNQVAQGESSVYRGVEYRIVHAELWNYSDYFKQHEELQKYEDSINNTENWKILLVQYEIKIKEEDGLVDAYIPVKFEHTFNGMDPFMFEAMNPLLAGGTIHSGDSIVIPYEIYKEGLTEKQWKRVEDMSMQYAAIVGVYPVRNEMLITDIEKKSGWQED